MTRRKEAGQALVFAVASLGVLLMGFAGLGIDIGYLRYEKRLQQTAADAAALGGAAELLYSGGYAAAAQYDAASNGFTNGTNNVTVTVKSPPLSGPHAGCAVCVEVYVAQVQPTFFMRILGITNETVTARAVSAIGNSTGCFYTLGTSGFGMNMTGGTISAANCSIVDDAGLQISGGSIQASSIGVSGAYSQSGGSVNPTPTTGTVAASDPLAYLTPPPVGSPCTLDPNVNSGSQTLNPGTYCGVTIGGGTVTFNPGVYVITGNFNVSGGTVNGATGVMFYETTGTINLSGGVLNLSAPTTSNSGTGAKAGIVLWQAASDTNAAKISGGSLAGALYFPGASLTISGGSATPYTIVVAKTVQIPGGTLTLNADYSSLGDGSPIKSAVLVE